MEPSIAQPLDTRGTKRDGSSLAVKSARSFCVSPGVGFRTWLSGVAFHLLASLQYVAKVWRIQYHTPPRSSGKTSKAAARWYWMAEEHPSLVKASESYKTNLSGNDSIGISGSSGPWSFSWLRRLDVKACNDSTNAGTSWRRWRMCLFNLCRCHAC